MSVQRICVVGAGYGGLMAARLLSETCREVVLVSGNPVGREDVMKRSTTDQVLAAKALGVWSPGLRAFREAGILKAAEQAGEYMEVSGYLNPDGAVLAQPSSLGMLDEFQVPASILFLKEQQVLELLWEQVRQRSNIEVIEEDFAGVDSTTRPIKVLLENQAIIPNVDMLIGADGRLSSVRRAVTLRDAQDGEMGKLRYRGFRVYRGLSSTTIGSSNCSTIYSTPASPQSSVLEGSFQTWGDGVRFASVPLRSGRVWFAAIADQQRFLVPVEPELMTSADFQYVREKVGSWHEPILELIDSTPPGMAIHEDAWSMSKFAEAQLGHVVLIGDATHTLDPILALGASVAMEDASLLCKLVSSAHVDQLPKLLRKFARQRNRRVTLLERLSSLSQFLGTTTFTKARDSLFMYTPGFFKTFVFDQILHVVAEEQTFRVK